MRRQRHRARADASPPRLTAPRGAWRALRALAGAAAIVAAACAVAAPALHGEWLWDDDVSITANPVTRGPYSFRDVWVAPTGPDYFPLTATAFWAEWHLFGDRVTGYHAVNVALHALSSLLLWVLVATLRLPGGWSAGMLFAVHPLCVESVAWISELKNTLSQPLFLAAAIHAVRSAERDLRRPTTDDVWALVWFVAAMFAKTSVVMFPVVMLLHAWWRRGFVGPRDVWRAVPFFVVSLLLGLVTLHFQQVKAIGDEPIVVGGVASRVALAGTGMAFYLGKVLVPVGLLPIYPRWEIDPPRAWQFVPWVVLAAAVARAWIDRSTWGRHAIFALGFFVVMLLPVLGFVTIAYMRITWAADHFVYLPMISIVVAVAATATARYEALPEWSRGPAAAAGVALLAGLGVSAARYGAMWVDEPTLWNHTLAGNPGAWQAHNRLGALYYKAGDIEAAHEHFVASSRLRPDLGETNTNLGLTLIAKGRTDEGIAVLERAVAREPRGVLFRVNLASAYSATGRFDEADALLRAIIEEYPESIAPRAQRADVLARQGRFLEAAAQYRIVLERDPGDATLWNNRGVCLLNLGRDREAAACFRQALALAPGLTDARRNLARVAEPAAPVPAER